MTAVEYNGKLQTQFVKIGVIYLSGWFCLDLMACFPFEMVQTLTTGNSENINTNSMARLSKLPRFYRLIKVVRLFRLLKFYKSLYTIFRILKIDKSVGKMINVLVAVFFIVHLVSCAWYFIDFQAGFEPDCWVVRQGLTDADILFRYISAAYWTFQTLSTVGYGDIPAVTLYEKVFAILWMIFGFAFYSYTIGNFQSILNEIDQKSYKCQIKLDTMLDFAKRTQLPPALQKEISRFIINNASNEEIVPKAMVDILEELPLSLKGLVIR